MEWKREPPVQSVCSGIAPHSKRLAWTICFRRGKVRRSKLQLFTLFPFLLSLIVFYFSPQGAGFAGGIVSAAVDGLFVADAVKAKFFAQNNESTLFDGKASVGFDY